jgi:hypothetical protein
MKSGLTFGCLEIAVFWRGYPGDAGAISGGLGVDLGYILQVVW